MVTSPARLAARLAVSLAATALIAVSACSVPVSADLSPADQSVAATPSSAASSSRSSSTPTPTRATAPSAASSPTSCTSNYHAGATSLDLIMQNNTGQTLTLDPTRTGRGDDGAHWAAQPPASLAPGECAVINAYSHDPFVLWLTATYLLPDGTFIPFACTIDGGSCNSSAFLTMNNTSYENGTFSGTTSDSWQISTAAQSGKVFLHFTLVAEPQS